LNSNLWISVETKYKTIINQQKSSGGVAQLVRARDS